MRDYRLSEIKEICKTTIGGCNNCKIQNECHLLSALQPHGWDIEQSDIGELFYSQKRLINETIMGKDEIIKQLAGAFGEAKRLCSDSDCDGCQYRRFGRNCIFYYYATVATNKLCAIVQEEKSK